KGKSEKTVGHVKEAVGDLTGNNELQAEGAKDQAKGQLHDTIGAVKQVGKDIKAGIEEGADRAKANKP
ncbi:MAG TPA: CsbD family protein, partial [Acidobacteriaceae bacterium]